MKFILSGVKTASKFASALMLPIQSKSMKWPNLVCNMTHCGKITNKCSFHYPNLMYKLWSVDDSNCERFKGESNKINTETEKTKEKTKEKRMGENIIGSAHLIRPSEHTLNDEE